MSILHKQCPTARGNVRVDDRESRISSSNDQYHRETVAEHTAYYRVSPIQSYGARETAECEVQAHTPETMLMKGPAVHIRWVPTRGTDVKRQSSIFHFAVRSLHPYTLIGDLYC